jgi:hypothetical protein
MPGDAPAVTLDEIAGQAGFDRRCRQLQVMLKAILNPVPVTAADVT